MYSLFLILFDTRLFGRTIDYKRFVRYLFFKTRTVLLIRTFTNTFCYPDARILAGTFLYIRNFESNEIISFSNTVPIITVSFNVIHNLPFTNASKTIFVLIIKLVLLVVLLLMILFSIFFFFYEYK